HPARSRNWVYPGGVMSRYVAATTKDFGELIRGFRKQRGWTQARLAERAGLLPKTVSAIEAGGGQVLLANVMRCLSALDVDLSLDSRSGPRTVQDPSTASRATSAANTLKEKW